MGDDKAGGKAQPRWAPTGRARREPLSPPRPASEQDGEEGRRRLGSGGQVWGPTPN